LDKIYETSTPGRFLKKNAIFSALEPDPEANKTIFFIPKFLSYEILVLLPRQN